MHRSCARWFESHPDSRDGAHQWRRSLRSCIWIGFSGLYATAGAFAWLLLSGRGMLLPHLIGGIALGLVPWGLQYQSTGQHAFVTIYEANESAPSLSRVPFKLSTLFLPRQLVALFGLPEAGLGWKWGRGWAIAGWFYCGSRHARLMQRPILGRPHWGYSCLVGPGWPCLLH